MCTNEQQQNTHLPMHNGNAISHCLTSYQSCSGLGWGRCGAYNGPEQRQKATVQTDGGCCWPSAVPGPVEAETPSCSGWDWRGGWGRMRSAAAVAAGMLWLVDYHCSEWWRRIEEDISWACVQTTGSTMCFRLHISFLFSNIVEQRQRQTCACATTQHCNDCQTTLPQQIRRKKFP